MRRGVPLLLLSALLLSAAHAEAGPWRGDLVGPSVAADAQVLEADVVALRIPLEEGADVSSWVLEGAWLEVVTHVEAEGPSAPPDLDDPTAAVEPRTHEERATHTDFLARATRAGAGVLYVFPHPDGTATLERSIGVVELVPSGDDVVDPGDDAPRHQRPHDAARAVLVEDREPPLQYVVRGDLLLDVSSVNWTVEDSNGSAGYHSGHRVEPVVPLQQGEPPVGREERRHLFLYVRDGELRIPGQSLRPDLYLDAVRIESERSQLRAASGTLTAGATSLDLSGDAVEFRDGNRLLGVRSTGRLLSYQVVSDGAGGAVYVGGDRVEAQPEPAVGVAASSMERAGEASAAWLFLLPILAVVLARPPFWFVAGALRLRLRRFAAWHAPRFLRSRHAVRAVLVGAVALLGLGRFGDARRFLDGVPVAARPVDGTWSYLHAHASAGAGEDDEAADHLERCLRAAPEHGPQVLANPVLRGVVAGRPERFGRLVGVPLP